MASSSSLAQPLKRLLISSITSLLRLRTLPPPPASPLSSCRRRLFSTQPTPLPLPLPYVASPHLVFDITAHEHILPAFHSRELFPCFATDSEKILYLRFNMPGVTKEGLKVEVELPHKLIVEGMRVADPDLNEIGVMYGLGFVLPDKFFKIDQIKQAMSNGVLNLAVPKKVRGEVVCDLGEPIKFSIKPC